MLLEQPRLVDLKTFFDLLWSEQQRRTSNSAGKESGRHVPLKVENLAIFLRSKWKYRKVLDDKIFCAKATATALFVG
jgi:hypothetical protein